MSQNGSVNTVESTQNQQITNYDNSFIFLRDNKYEGGSFENATGADLTLAPGTLMGRVAATGLLVVLKSGATDGSQYPVGVLTQETEVLDTETVDIKVCVAGEIQKESVVFDGTDDYDTVVEDRTLLDRIGADTVGIKVIAGTEMTAFDNQ